MGEKRGKSVVVAMGRRGQRSLKSLIMWVVIGPFTEKILHNQIRGEKVGSSDLDKVEGAMLLTPPVHLKTRYFI